MAARIAPNEAHTLITREGYTHVDVRSVPEYEGGHPEGAYNIPFMHAGAGGMTPNPDFLAAFEAHFPRDAKLVIGCLSGGRSARACAALEAAGYTHLVDQRAGFGGARDPFGRVTEAGWSGAGLPTAAGPDAERGWSALAPKRA